MQFQHNLRRKTPDIKIYDSNHRQETTGQDDERKNLGIEKLIKQNTYAKYEKKNKKNIIQEALITMKQQQTIEGEPIQRIQTFGARTKGRCTGNNGNRPCRNCNAPTVTIAVRKDITQERVDKE